MKKNKLLIGLAFTFLMLSGCATNYDVEKSYWTGGVGFSQTQLENDIWKIDFTGNAHTNSDVRRQYILKKAAQVAIKEGYTFFKVQGEAEKVLSDESVVRGNASVMGSGRSNKSPTGSNTFTTMTVKLLHKKEGVDGVVYEANSLANSIIE